MPWNDRDEKITRKGSKLCSEEEIPLEVKESFNILKVKYGQTVRISDLLKLINDVTGVQIEVDDRMWTPMVLSRLLDYQKDFYDGKEIVFEELFDFIASSFEIGKKQKQLLNRRHVEDGLWAILLALTDPSHAMFNF